MAFSTTTTISRPETWSEPQPLIRKDTRAKWMEYEPQGCRWLVQGILAKDSKEPYPSLPWKLGMMAKIEFGAGQGVPVDAQ